MYNSVEIKELNTIIDQQSSALYIYIENINFLALPFIPSRKQNWEKNIIQTVNKYNSKHNVTP